MKHTERESMNCVCKDSKTATVFTSVRQTSERIGIAIYIYILNNIKLYFLKH